MGIEQFPIISTTSQAKEGTNARPPIDCMIKAKITDRTGGLTKPLRLLVEISP